MRSCVRTMKRTKTSTNWSDKTLKTRNHFGWLGNCLGRCSPSGPWARLQWHLGLWSSSEANLQQKSLDPISDLKNFQFSSGYIPSTHDAEGYSKILIARIINSIKPDIKRHFPQRALTPSKPPVLERGVFVEEVDEAERNPMCLAEGAIFVFPRPVNIFHTHMH